MSEHIHVFESGKSLTALSLPFELQNIISQWDSLRRVMIRRIPEEFTREEWAYVITFLDSGNLYKHIENAFGNLQDSPIEKASFMARPRGAVAIWLPNNVSLLGSLLVILLSLTGNRVEAKRGTRGKDLTEAFLKFAIENLPDGDLKSYLKKRVRAHSFGRDDRKNREMASDAAVRIVFGADETATAVHALPHPVESIAFSFIDRRSEAWIEKRAVNEEVLVDLVKVFSIYGQAGCTSPSRVVLLDAKMEEALDIRDKILDIWPKVVTDRVAMHVASDNIMSAQLLSASGWDVKCAPLNGAVIAVGNGTPHPSSLMTLFVVPSSLKEAVKQLPSNAQTIGYALTDPTDPKWLKLLSRSTIKRFVPISRMHHFGAVWDGYDFWSQLFEKVEVQL